MIWSKWNDPRPAKLPDPPAFAVALYASPLVPYSLCDSVLKADWKPPFECAISRISMIASPRTPP